jgi:hypothetical protein
MFWKRKLGCEENTEKKTAAQKLSESAARGSQ